MSFIPVPCYSKDGVKTDKRFFLINPEHAYYFRHSKNDHQTKHFNLFGTTVPFGKESTKTYFQAK